MVQQSEVFYKFTNAFYQTVEKQFRGKFWKIKLGLLYVLLALFFQIPRYNVLYKFAVAKTEHNAIYDYYVRQVAEPFKMHSMLSDFRMHGMVSETHVSKMVFRLTVPLIIRLLHLPPVSVFLLQFVAGLLMYWLLVQLIEQTTQDRVVTVLLTLGTSCIYFGCDFLHGIYATFDSFSYCIVIALMYFHNPFVLSGLVIAGAFNDERTIIVLPIVLLWHLWYHNQPAANDGVMRLVAKAVLNKQVLAIGVGLLIYVGLRGFLAVHYHLTTFGGLVGLDALQANALAGTIETGLFSGLESFWLLIFVFIIVFSINSLHRPLLLVLLAFAPIALGALLVIDITRSVAYGTPIYILCLRSIVPYTSRTWLRNLAALIMVGAILIPSVSTDIDVKPPSTGLDVLLSKALK